MEDGEQGVDKVGKASDKVIRPLPRRVEGDALVSITYRFGEGQDAGGIVEGTGGCCRDDCFGGVIATGGSPLAEASEGYRGGGAVEAVGIVGGGRHGCQAINLDLAESPGRPRRGQPGPGGGGGRMSLGEAGCVAVAGHIRDVAIRGALLERLRGDIFDAIMSIRLKPSGSFCFSPGTVSGRRRVCSSRPRRSSRAASELPVARPSALIGGMAALS